MIRTNSQRAGGRYYTRYLAHYAKKNHTLLIFAALFLAGVGAGTLLISSAGSGTLDILMRMVGGFIEKRREGPVLYNLLSCASSSLTFIAALFICGFCAISQPVIVFIPFLRGLGFGFSAASLYAGHGASATGFVALFLLPNMLISSIAILLCAKESMRLSISFWQLMCRSKEEMYPLRIYIGRYVAAAVLCIFSAFLESVLYFAFANLMVLQ